jgi:hypothetical protein
MGVTALIAVVGSTQSLKGGVFGGEIMNRAGTSGYVFEQGALSFFIDGVLGVACCVGTFLTFI